jgi:DNA-directed RNA polymerase specialized sigma24 family protein
MSDLELNGDSVTEWIASLRAGDPAAAQSLWERYFERLVQTARARLRPRGDVDGEDVALSAFDSFCHAVERGRVPQLGDRNDLWRFLIFITAQKISKVIARENTLIRGAGVVPQGDSAIAQVVGREPSPDFAAEVADTFRDLLEALDDENLRRVALWKMEGYTNEEIALRLDCSLKTVSNKLKLVRLKLECQCR